MDDDSQSLTTKKPGQNNNVTTTIMTTIQQQQHPEDNEPVDEKQLIIKQEQIHNFQSHPNETLVLYVRVLNHAGSATCALFEKYGPVPKPNCLTHTGWPLEDLPHPSVPWEYDKTAKFIQELRPYYSTISWQFDALLGSPKPPISTTNWEHPQLVSFIVMRNPMDRLLAGNAHSKTNYNFTIYNEDERTAEAWWKFASTSIMTNNFALKVLAGSQDCCDGANTPRYHLDNAKALLRRFTFILDQDCLGESFLALAKTLGLSLVPVHQVIHNHFDRIYDRRHPVKKTARERINNDTLYEYLQNRNRLDIELYEWAKTKSIVKC